jgi:amino acid permease
LLKETPSIFISRPDLPFTFMKMDYFMLASKILFFITLHVLCAIVNNILRTSLKAVFYNGKEIPKKNDVITVICLYLCTYLITYFIKDLLSILSILGGICAVVLSFVMPILCWIKTNSYEVIHWKNISALIVMCVTIVIGLCCVGYSIYCDIRGMI